MKKIIPTALLVCVLLANPLFSQEAPGPVPDRFVSSQEVSGAVDKAVAYLKAQQAANGSWPYPTADHLQGASALCVFALSEAGVPKDDPAIQTGLEFVLSKPLTRTYDTGCAALALASVAPGTYMRDIAATRQFLEGSQLSNGMWTYGSDTVNRTGGDNSNTQFAMLGLNAAMSVGLEVSPQVLAKALEHYASTQNSDGGWGYQPGQSSYGSMTAAGAAALHILGSKLYVESNVCGQYSQDPRLAGAFAWLARNYSVTSNPKRQETWLLYYLYALERVGVFTGEKYIGGNDWYLEGARYIVDTQKADGSWGGGRDVIPNTCFALLFLAKGNVPVLINKLAHEGEWNADVHDAQNLARFVSRSFGQQVGWQTVTLSDSLETLLSAPILYVTGHRFPDFSQQEMAKLNDFFEQGGFMFAEACCARPEFFEGAKRFAAGAFPDYQLRQLDKSHTVYRIMFNIRERAGLLHGVEAGCRTAMMVSPKDLSCAWERNDPSSEAEAFELGANIAAYVTAREILPSKLDQFKAVTTPKILADVPNAFTFAQIKYVGGWNPHPLAGQKLLEFLNAEAGLYVSSRQVNLPLSDVNLPNFPFLYMTGRRAFTLSDEEKTALREYIERGGFLFADATVGRKEFDESFRAMMAEVLPDSPLEPIDAGSEIYRIAFDTTRVKYTASVRETSPNLNTLTLYGATVEDRIAVVYSPYDIGCALEQVPVYGSRGLVREDAFRVAANIVLYALTY